MIDWFAAESVLSLLLTLAVAAGGIAIAVWASRNATLPSEHIAHLLHRSPSAKTNGSSASTTTTPPRKASQK